MIRRWYEVYDKYKATVQQHRSLYQNLLKKGHEVNIHPVILEMQGSDLKCFEAGVIAVGVHGPHYVALVRAQKDHAVTFSANIIGSRRFLEHKSLLLRNLQTGANVLSRSAPLDRVAGARQ